MNAKLSWKTAVGGGGVTGLALGEKMFTYEFLRILTYEHTHNSFCSDCPTCLPVQFLPHVPHPLVSCTRLQDTSC